MCPDPTRYLSQHRMQAFGVYPVGDGIMFRLWALLNTDIQLVLFDEDGTQTRRRISDGENGLRSVVVPDARDGQRYLCDIDGRIKSGPRQCRHRAVSGRHPVAVRAGEGGVSLFDGSDG